MGIPASALLSLSLHCAQPLSNKENLFQKHPNRLLCAQVSLFRSGSQTYPCLVCQEGWKGADGTFSLCCGSGLHQEGSGGGRSLTGPMWLPQALCLPLCQCPLQGCMLTDGSLANGPYCLLRFPAQKRQVGGARGEVVNL